MKAIETFAYFNEEGELQINKVPALKNKKVKLLILIEEEIEKDTYELSLSGLAGAYANDEPEYNLSMVREKNENYAGR